MVPMAINPKITAAHPAIFDSYVRMTRNDKAERPNMTKDKIDSLLIFNLQLWTGPII